MLQGALIRDSVTDLGAAAGLVHHHPGVRERGPLAFGPGAEQQRPHAASLPHAQRRDLGLDVLRPGRVSTGVHGCRAQQARKKNQKRGEHDAFVMLCYSCVSVAPTRHSLWPPLRCQGSDRPPIAATRRHHTDVFGQPPGTIDYKPQTPL